jgi:putative transposase
VLTAKVQRLMREDNPLCLRKRRLVVTSDSNRDLPAPEPGAKYGADGHRQAMVADLTYIRLGTKFVYLAVILMRSRAR